MRSRAPPGRPTLRLHVRAHPSRGYHFAWPRGIRMPYPVPNRPSCPAPRPHRSRAGRRAGSSHPRSGPPHPSRRGRDRSDDPPRRSGHRRGIAGRPPDRRLRPAHQPGPRRLRKGVPGPAALDAASRCGEDLPDQGSEAQTLAQLDHDYIVRVFDQRILPEQASGCCICSTCRAGRCCTCCTGCGAHRRSDATVPCCSTSSTRPSRRRARSGQRNRPCAENSKR